MEISSYFAPCPFFVDVICAELNIIQQFLLNVIFLKNMLVFKLKSLILYICFVKIVLNVGFLEMYF